MKPQTSAFLDKAREFLGCANTMFGVGLNEDAGRTAYLAGLHAAQALIFETTGRVSKRHAAVQGEFGRLAKDEPSVDLELRAFLGRAYNFKAIADYQTGPVSHVTAGAARDAIETARRNVPCLPDYPGRQLRSQSGLCRLSCRGRRHWEESLTHSTFPAVFPAAPPSRGRGASACRDRDAIAGLGRPGQIANASGAGEIGDAFVGTAARDLATSANRAQRQALTGAPATTPRTTVTASNAALPHCRALAR
jgi:uncharacterized protein (UPF0332 family)